jgi:hypothetical protein
MSEKKRAAAVLLEAYRDWCTLHDGVTPKSVRLVGLDDGSVLLTSDDKFAEHICQSLGIQAPPLDEAMKTRKPTDEAE